jgi:hypothetical protein
LPCWWTTGYSYRAPRCVRPHREPAWWPDRLWFPGQAGEGAGIGMGQPAPLVELFPGTPVTAATVPAQLPWVLQSEPDRVRIGWLMVAGSLVAGLALKPIADWTDAPWFAVAGRSHSGPGGGGRADRLKHFVRLES